MPMRGNRQTRTRTVVLLTTAALLVQPSAASAAPSIHVVPAADSAATKSSGDATAATITLITGDTVSLTRHANGTATSLIAPGPGRERMTFATRTVHKRMHVVPHDAQPLIAAGRLDARLFDVTRLVEFGYDDAKSASLPLIITGAGRAVRGLDLVGSRVTRALPSIGGVAVAESKKSAATFWRALTGGASASGFAAPGIGKVWLSGKAKLLDAGSNKQIGVPAARAAGYDGRGVTVAVLDSGVDPTHPDLKEILGETKDFTSSPEGVKDTHGHGTHVASIIAGTGAKTPDNAGVAPAARLMAGKVCGDDTCEEAAIIAGLEWAAGKAKVVNLSFGSSAGADGTDPLSQAINSLTASTGTLFVAAAGNSYSSYTVGSPAAADAALAVASVGRGDGVSDFSSKGPRVGDHSVKPDIAAPGEDIVAARAAGTSMGDTVDDHYTAASGTSMASPHVAGVAALVAQAHPDWTANDIKHALMSSSAVPAGLNVFAGGAGRLDAARAVSQKLFTDGSVSFPLVAWPRPAAEPIRKTVTYRNRGSAPVTLDLKLSDDTAFSLASSTVTVPANGSAGVSVSLDPTKLPNAGGAVSARISATNDDIVVRTAVGVVAEPESYDVKVTVLDRNGKPASGELYQAVNIHNYTRLSGSDFSPDVVDGVAKARVPKGTYAITSEITTAGDEETGRAPSSTQEIVTKFTVEKDTAITLDARKGVRTAVTVADRPAAVQQVLNTDFRLGIGPGFIGGGLMAFDAKSELYVVPTTAAEGATLEYGLSAVLTSPKDTRRPYKYYLTPTAPPDVIPTNPVWTVRTSDLAQRSVRQLAQGKPAHAEFARAPHYLKNQFISFGAWTTVDLPTKRTDYLSTNARWSTVMAFQRPAGEPRTAPFGYIFDLTGEVTKGKPVPESWNRAAVAPSLALTPNYASGVMRFDDQLAAYVPMFSPAGPNQGNFTGFQSMLAKGKTKLTLGDGEESAESPTPGLATFGGLPDQEAQYTLTASATRTDWVAWSDLSTTTETSWTFRSSAKDQILPLMYLRSTGPVDDLNKAPAGLFPLSVEVLRQPRTTSTAKVRSVTVEYSADDGKTWKRSPIVVGSGNTWRAVVVNPRSGFASLRLTATDSAGDRHSVTVIRAYGIR
jgi:hypothetical protein